MLKSVFTSLYTEELIFVVVCCVLWQTPELCTLRLERDTATLLCTAV